MKRTVLTKLAIAAVLLQIGAAMNGVYAAESAKPAVAGSEAASPKQEQAKDATGKAGKSEAKESAGDAKKVDDAKKSDEAKKADEAKKSDADDDGMLVDVKVPLMSSLFAKMPIAVVNGDKIPLEEFTDVVNAMHQSMTDSKEGSSSNKSLSVLLKRLVNTRLFVQEAKNIELDKLPEIKETIDKENKKILREILYLKIASKAQPSEKDVERNYYLMTHEVRLKSIAFVKEAEAKKFIGEVNKGQNFQALAEQAFMDNRAERPDDAPGFVKLALLHPRVSAAVEKMQAGQTSQKVIPMGGKYLAFKVLETRVVEMPGQRDEARANLMNKAQIDALNAYKEELFKKYMKQNKKLIASLDFEAKKPGFKALLNDKRVLVSVTGEKPITVADLAQAVQAKFFHGVDLAIKEGKVNKEKGALLDQLMSRVAYDKDTVAQRLDQSEEYLKRSGELERGTLFGVFIEKVIKPEVRGTDAELKDYYKAHADEYTSPEVIKVDGIVFKKLADAKASVDKLRQGMEMKWLRTNADGLVGADAPNLIEGLEDQVPVPTLPDAAQKVMAGAKLGEYRIYESPEGYNYVLHVAQVEPKQVRPYMAVREDIAKIIWEDKMSKVIDDWGDKLRKASNVRVFLQIKQKSPTP
jgi:hypothetical protein